MAEIIHMDSYCDYRLGLITKEDVKEGKVFTEVLEEMVDTLSMEEFDVYVQNLFNI
jgi:hypothetical protein